MTLFGSKRPQEIYYISVGYCLLSVWLLILNVLCWGSLLLENVFCITVISWCRDISNHDCDIATLSVNFNYVLIVMLSVQIIEMKI